MLEQRQQRVDNGRLHIELGRQRRRAQHNLGASFRSLLRKHGAQQRQHLTVRLQYTSGGVYNTFARTKMEFNVRCHHCEPSYANVNDRLRRGTRDNMRRDHHVQLVQPPTNAHTHKIMLSDKKKQQ
jgi:hypothetical protein